MKTEGKENFIFGFLEYEVPVRLSQVLMSGRQLNIVTWS